MTQNIRANAISPDPTTIHPAEEGARERIVAAAIALFSAKGYERTPVREIVQAAGVTQPVLYYYFRNKEALFRWIVEDRMGDYHQRLAEVCSGAQVDLSRQLAAIAQVYFDKAREEPDLVRFIFNIAFSGLFDHMFDFEGGWKRDIERIASVFDRARSGGAVRRDFSSQALAFHFAGMVVNVMKGLVYCPEMIEEEPDGVVLARLFMEGVAPR